MKKIVFAAALGITIVSHAFAQVPVKDAANIAISESIKELSKQIQGDTSIVKDNTIKTLQAITGDRSQDASQFAKLATGNGFSMGQAPDFNSILSGNEGKRSADGVGLEVPWHQGFDVGGRPALSDAA